MKVVDSVQLVPWGLNLARSHCTMWIKWNSAYTWSKLQTSSIAGHVCLHSYYTKIHIQLAWGIHTCVQRSGDLLVCPAVSPVVIVVIVALVALIIYSHVWGFLLRKTALWLVSVTDDTSSFLQTLSQDVCGRILLQKSHCSFSMRTVTSQCPL